MHSPALTCKRWHWIIAIAPSLKKKDPYTTDALSTEIDRLLTSFRDNGYYKITRESVYAEVDTVVAALIDPNARSFRTDPTARLVAPKKG